MEKDVPALAGLTTAVPAGAEAGARAPVPLVTNVMGSTAEELVELVDACHERTAVIPRRDVGTLKAPARQALSERLSLLFVQIGHENARAVVSQVLGNRPADAAGGAGHECRLTREVDGAGHGSTVLL